MRVAVRENRQDEFYALASQCAQVDIDRVKLALVDFAPLTQRSDLAISDLI